MSIPSWAVAGAKVVCVATPWEGRRLYDVSTPELKHVYTIRRAFLSKGWNDGMPSIILEEIRAIWNGKEYGFDLDGFRPIVTKTQAQDVRAIKSMIAKMPASDRLDRLEELLNE